MRLLQRIAAAPSEHARQVAASSTAAARDVVEGAHNHHVVSQPGRDDLTLRKSWFCIKLRALKTSMPLFRAKIKLSRMRSSNDTCTGITNWCHGASAASRHTTTCTTCSSTGAEAMRKVFQLGGGCSTAHGSVSKAERGAE